MNFEKPPQDTSANEDSGEILEGKIVEDIPEVDAEKEYKSFGETIWEVVQTMRKFKDGYDNSPEDEKERIRARILQVVGATFTVGSITGLVAASGAEHLTNVINPEMAKEMIQDGSLVQEVKSFFAFTGAVGIGTGIGGWFGEVRSYLGVSEKKNDKDR